MAKTATVVDHPLHPPDLAFQPTQAIGHVRTHLVRELHTPYSIAVT